MTKAEEIRLHNLFIKFKNEGKELDEIEKLLPTIDTATLENWNEELDEKKQEIDNLPYESSIIGINELGKYLYQNQISFNPGQLELAKFNLTRIIWTIEDGQPENEFQEKAKIYLPVFQRYFSNLDINIDINTQQISANYKLTSEDENIRKLAKEAVEFYGQIQAFEIFHHNYCNTFFEKQYSIFKTQYSAFTTSNQ